MTSSSASGSTCRILYGFELAHAAAPSPSDATVVGAPERHGCALEPEARDRGGERVGGLRAEPAEQVAHDVAAGGGDRQRQDRPEEAGQRPADDDRER